MKSVRNLAWLLAVVAVCVQGGARAAGATRVEYLGRVSFTGLKLGYCGGPQPCPYEGVRVGEFAHLTFVLEDVGIPSAPWPPCPGRPDLTPTEIEFRTVDGSYFVTIGGVRLAAPVLATSYGGTNPASVVDWENCTVDQMNMKGAALLGLGGSCCYPNGSCTYVLEGDCVGGVWTFGGACVTRNDCAQPMGVCCGADNTCTITTQAGCGGVNWSYGGTCEAGVSCPQQVGSCCSTNGSCAITTSANCADMWTADGLCGTCVDPAFGFSYGVIELRVGGPTGFFSSAEVTQNHGVRTGFGPDYRFWQINIGCLDARGPRNFSLDVPIDAFVMSDSSAALGACCPGDGKCYVTTQGACEASTIGGAWTSGGTCDGNPCAAAAGACCYSDGTCQLALASVCQGTPNAVYLGDTSACINGACPATGGCCVGGTCSTMSEAACLAQNGTWLGSGSDCLADPQVMQTLGQTAGACCTLSNGFCKIVYQTSCTGSGNVWTAGGTCEAACPDAVKCCFPSTGYCDLRAAQNCISNGGEPDLSGSGETCATACAPFGTPFELGACCNPVSGSCTLTVESACVCGGDIWSATQTCAQLCPVVVGACCNTFDGSCRLVSQEFCNGSVVWHGDRTCATPCQSTDGKFLTDAVFSIPLQTTIPGETQETLVVTDSRVIQTLEVWLTVSTSRLNDYRVQLIGPNNVTAELFVRVDSPTASDCAGTRIGPGHTMNGLYIFKDSAAMSFWDYVTGPLTTPVFITAADPGSYKASGCGGAAVSLNALFGGMSFAGTWTLKVRDERSGIPLKLASWGISVNQSGDAGVCEADCPGDFDENGTVEVADIFAFLNAWFGQFNVCVVNCSADIDENGIVQVGDIFAFLGEWFGQFGQACP